MKKIQSVILLPALMFVLFVLFNESINDLLSKAVVRPVLSKIQFIAHPAQQWAFTILLAMPIMYLLVKWNSGYRYSVHRIVWFVALVAAYIYSRINSTWHFTDWLSFKGMPIKAVDALVSSSFLSFLLLWLKDRLSIKSGSYNPLLGFETDKPIVIEKNDVNQRWRYIDTIATLLLNADTEERAFAIGITGEWGSGKTSFMDTLEQRLSAAKNLLQLHFNPWLISDAKGITAAFFSELSYRLSQKTDMLTSDLSDYMRIITSEIEGNAAVKVLKKALPAFRWNRNGIDELRSSINDSLRELDKKLIIYIDDLDRLDDEEITEVLRIIRNSADFANIVFVVAYDKTQINSALSGKFKQGSTKYVEKVFQHEFHLPPIDRNILLAELNVRLEPILSEYDNEARKVMFERQNFKQNYSSLKNHLRHYRDVSRFVNIFKVHYPYLQNHVFLPDLYLVIFLRLKYPAIASMLYEERNNLLTNFPSGVVVFVEKKQMFIELTMSNEDTKKTKLEVRLDDGKWGLDTEQKQDVMDIASSLFRPINNSSVYFQNDVPNAEVTIRDPDCFDRYFDEDLNSRLSNIEFQNAFSQPKTAFLKQVEEWMKDAQMAKDLIKTLERRDQFNNKEDFEKVLSALALIDDFAGEESTLPLYGRIEERKFLERIAYERAGNGLSRTARLFGGFQEFQDYVRSFLKEDLRYGSIRYRLAEEMSKGSMADYATLPPDEVRAMIKTEVFEKKLAEDSTVDVLFRVYGLLEQRATEEEKNEMKESLLHFVLTKDLEGFMKWIPKPCFHSERGYKLDEWSDKFFGDSIDAFVAQLDVNRLSDSGKEVIEFLEKYKARQPSEECIDFDFKAMKVRKLNGGWSE